MVAAHLGREHDARADATPHLTSLREVRSPRLMEWPLRTLGFLEVSLGNYAEAVRALQPPLREFEASPGTEIVGASFLPDAIEALVALGRHAEAEPLIDGVGRQRPLERPGCSPSARGAAACRWPPGVTSRPPDEGASKQWSSTTGCRCASNAPAPSSCWVSCSVVSAKRTATATLQEALQRSRIGTPLWADRARAELARTNVAPGRTTGSRPPSSGWPNSRHQA